MQYVFGKVYIILLSASAFFFLGCGILKSDLKYSINTSSTSQTIRLNQPATLSSSGGPGPYTYSILSGAASVNSFTGVLTDIWTSGQILIQTLDAYQSATVTSVTALPSAIEFGVSGQNTIGCTVIDSAGNLYALGSSTGNYPGSPNQGGNDFLLTKFNKSGSQVWVKTFGTAGDDRPPGTPGQCIGVDSTGIYIVGITNGSFPGYASAGGQDIFVAQLDTGLTATTWISQVGTAGADSSLGSTIIDPSNNILIAATTTGAFPGFVLQGPQDIVLAKFNPAGVNLWVKQYGSPGTDFMSSIAHGPQGSVYLAGHTDGAFAGFTNAGGKDGFLMHLNNDGSQDWVQQFGSSLNDQIWSVFYDGVDGIFLGGDTMGSLPGYNFANIGAPSALLLKFNKLGIQQ